MARVIDDPSLERPRYAKGLRWPSTLQHVLPYSVSLSVPTLSFSLEEKLPRVSLPAIFSRGYNIYTASQIFAVLSFSSPIFIKNSLPLEDNFFRSKIKKIKYFLISFLFLYIYKFSNFNFRRTFSQIT